MSALRSFVSSRIFKLPNFAPRWRGGDCFPIHKCQSRLCALLLSILPNFAARGVASPVRLLHRVQVVLALLQFRNFGLSGSECEFFSCYTFPYGSSGGNGFLRACSTSCDWVCNRSRCACSLMFSLRIVAGQSINFSLSCDNDVGDVGEVEQEERVDNTLDNEKHEVLRKILNFLPFFMRCGNWPQVLNPWASQRFK